MHSFSHPEMSLIWQRIAWLPAFIYVQASRAIDRIIVAFIKYSFTNNYITYNNFRHGLSFNENLLYLSPVLKKV